MKGGPGDDARRSEWIVGHSEIGCAFTGRSGISPVKPGSRQVRGKRATGRDSLRRSPRDPLSGFVRDNRTAEWWLSVIALPGTALR